MSEVGRLRDDFGWQSLRKSAVMAPTAIVEALCDYAEGQVDRLTEALEAARSVAQRDEAEKGRLWQHLRDRAERAEADLADEKRRQAGLRAGVEALAARAEKFAYMEPSGMGLANELRALLSDATTESQQTPQVGTEGRGAL